VLARRHSSSEEDDLLPHRESAWALPGERVRDASIFCDAVTKHSPDLVATALGPAQGALTAVADSHAAHFGDRGADRRSTTGHGALWSSVMSSRFGRDSGWN
jgi:hypothetical protein